MPDLVLPPLRRTARDAEVFARHVHADQLDKAGRPHVEHLERVAKAAGHAMFMRGAATDSAELDEVVQIAWLHDVIEDAEVSSDDLYAEGFAQDVIWGVNWLTRSDADRRSYLCWIGEICESASLPALLVKIADTEDNADPARLALLDEATRDRLTSKYASSLPILRAAINPSAHRLK